ncbi:hypothetical protein ABIE64_001588 [Thalassospira sp. MBR-102]|uniref:hypothetical protein n=1 Tax=Thalassospira sp. MBR-102 TaxID=3156466 RepID=UPI00339A39B6
MIILKTRVLSAKPVLDVLEANQKFRLLVNISDNVETNLKKIGLPEDSPANSTILPAVQGSTSRFNAYGKYLPLKQLPKISRYITTLEWTREQWAGRGETETVTTEVDIYRDCFQQEFIPPTSLEMTYIVKEAEHLIVSDEMNSTDTPEEIIKTYTNLFLEIFKNCEVVTSNLEDIQPTKIEKRNWTFLPVGEHPWERIEEHLRNRLHRFSDRKLNPIISRQKYIADKGISLAVVGNGGFRSYVAYIFKDKKLCVLESSDIDNATYVFGDNWEQLSQLTKAEILRGELHVHRVIHGKDWKDQIDKILG